MIYKILNRGAIFSAQLLGILGVILLVLVGCVPTEDSQKLLRVALSGSPDTLDPHTTSATLTFQVIRSVYDTLVEPDGEGNIMAGLAERWEIAGEGLEWRFYLRPGVRFHNGELLTAQDIKASLERIREVNSPRAAEFSAISRIEIADEHLVILHLSAPYAPLLASLGSGWAAILPHSLIAAGHDFSLQPVGSGPFSFQKWVKDGKIVLVKNEHYWKPEMPLLEMVAFHILTENAIRAQALLNNEIDVLDVIEPTDIARFEESPEVKIERQLSSLAMVIPINTSQPPLNDLRVRQVLSLAIDRQRVLDEAYGGGVPINTFMDYGDPYYPAVATSYSYDPQRAAALIRRHNLQLDKELELTVPQNFEPHIRAAEIYQQMWRTIGIEVALNLVDWPTWIGEVYSNANYELSVIGHTGRLDPHARFLEYGYTNWNNAELTQLVLEAQQTATLERRKELYSRALAIMAEELPFIFVGTNWRYVVTRNNVQGLIVDQKLDTFDFRGTYKAPLQ